MGENRVKNKDGVNSMTIFLMIILFLIGLLLIFKGGDAFVDAAGFIAEISGIPRFVIGATVVSLATTLPEMTVSIFGTASGMRDLAIGNAVGSVTANLGLIMAISILTLPAIVHRKEFAPKAMLMAVSALALLLVLRDGDLTPLESLPLMIILGIFLWLSLRTAKQESSAQTVRRKAEKKEKVTNMFKFILGAAAIVLGAKLLVDNGSGLARIFGVPENIIGLTLIAVGTSLPELVTTMISLSRKDSALSIGNIIGANILDLTMILPVCSLVAGGELTVGRQVAALDVPITFILILIAVLPTISKNKFSRWQGGLMLTIYIGYLLLLAMTS